MIEVKFTFNDEAELLAFLMGKGATSAAQPPAPVVEKPATEKKATAAPTPAPAPAPAPVVQEAAPAESPTSPAVAATSPSPAPAPSAPAVAAPPSAPAAQVAPVKYEDSGIPSAVPAYLGKPGSDGYDARRTKLVALLGRYGAASAKVLAPEQYAPFLADLKALQ